MNIIARNKQIKLFDKALKSDSPEFIAVYGRRRVGKTYLIKNYFEQKGIFFHITGTPKETARQQLVNFAHVYADVFNKGEDVAVPDTWQDAFHVLRKILKRTDKKQKIFFFFDELPWLSTKKSGFLEALTYFWNRYLSSDPRIILIVCGSAASWMINNVINAKGGLYNRVTMKIQLQPFTLYETEEYLGSKNIQLSRSGISELYMALGGVAGYLNMASAGMSPAQIIGNIIFNPDSLLFGEFDRLFKSLFSKSELHVRVIKTLMKKKTGMDKETLFKEVDITSGSVQNRLINELIESGFIDETPVFGKRKKGAFLRLIDEYSIFYLKWQKEMRNTRVPLRPDYWLVLQNSSAWKTWAGYAFESLCQNHIHQIASALGISGIIYSWSAWQHHPEHGKDEGVQIDMIIDRSDNCINLCEMKYHSGEFTVTKAYAAKLLYKKQKFIEVTGTKKTVFITLITKSGAKENRHFLSSVTNQLQLDDLFVEL